MIAIVAARGGSRRVPRKNTRLLCGHPLVAWSIVQAKYSQCVKEVYLTTDDEEIADIGRHYGAKIIMRPDWKEAGNLPATVPMYHACEKVMKLHPNEMHCAMILTTSPLRKPDDIDRAYGAFNRTPPPIGGLDVLITVVPELETVVMKLHKGGYTEAVSVDKKRQLATQGGGLSLWIMKEYLTANSWAVRQLLTETEMDKISPSEMDKKSGITLFKYYGLEVWQQFDIDEPDVFDLCEVLLEQYILKGKGMEVYKRYGR